MAKEGGFTAKGVWFMIEMPLRMLGFLSGFLIE